MIRELEALSAQLTNGKFLSHLLEPVLLWGVLIGTLAWILSVWVLRDRRAQLCSLLLLALSALSIHPVMAHRRKTGASSAIGVSLLNARTLRREDTQWVYYTLGGLAVAGLFLTGEGRGKSGKMLSAGLAAAGLATAVLSLWLHEGEVTLLHPEARRAKNNSGSPSSGKNFEIPP